MTSLARWACFITHDWGSDELGRDNHERAGRVAAALQEAGLAVWFDENELSGDVNAQMAEGIEESATVAVMVTSRYVTKVTGRGPSGANDNCKYEFDYALLRKGVERMIPIVMEPRCRNTSEWKGAVGGKLGPKLYIDLSEDGPAFEAGIDRLIDEIVKLAGAELPDSSGSELGAGHPQPRRATGIADVSTKPLATLDDREVCALLDGLRLNALAKTCKQHAITGADLACASDADLAHLGVALPMQRRRLLAQIDALRRTGVRLDALRGPTAGGASGGAGDEAPPPVQPRHAAGPSSEALRAMPWADLVATLRAAGRADTRTAERCLRVVVARASDGVNGEGGCGSAARGAAADAGAFGALVEAMGEHAAHAGVQELACAALIQLAAGADAAGISRKQAAADAGALGALVGALTAHREHVGVALSASWAIGNLCIGTDAAGLARKQAAADAGALGALVGALGEHSARANICEQAIKALGNLVATAATTTAASSPTAAAASTAAAAPRARTEESVDGALAAAVTDASLLALDRQRDALDAGVLGPLLAAMRKHAAHVGVQRFACMLLLNLASLADQTNGGLARRQAIVASGATALVVEALRAHRSGDAKTAEWAAQLIGVLVAGVDHAAPARKRAAIDAGALGALLGALSAPAPDQNGGAAHPPAVVENALRSLGAIIAGPDVPGPAGAAARAQAAVNAGARTTLDRIAAGALSDSLVAARAREVGELIRGLLAHAAHADVPSVGAAPSVGSARRRAGAAYAPREPSFGGAADADGAHPLELSALNSSAAPLGALLTPVVPAEAVATLDAAQSRKARRVPAPQP